MTATINYNSKGEKVAVPALRTDMFIGVFRPNIQHIDENGIPLCTSVNPDDYDEDQVVEGLHDNINHCFKIYKEDEEA